MALRFDHIVNVLLLCLSNLSIVAEGAQDGVSSLLFRVFGHLAKDLVTRQAQVLDYSLEELPIWIFT